MEDSRDCLKLMLQLLMKVNDNMQRESSKRVYIKLPIVNTEIIIKLQNYLIANIKNSHITPIAKEKLHMTLFHYGKPQELYEEIKVVNKELDFNSFLEDFYTLLSDQQMFRRDNDIILKGAELGISNIRPMTDNLDVFGDINEPIIVLRLKKPEELIEYRENIFNKFKEFLERSEVKDIEVFLKNSPNLKYQVNYNPHVSLGYSEKFEADLPSIDVSDIQILLGGLEIVN